MGQQQPRTKREKIASANIASTGLVDIYYVGGSMFEFDFKNKSNKPVRCSKAKLDELLAQGKVTLTAPKRYEEISRSIQADGTTKDQNADGTPKSAINKTLDMLKNDNIITERGDGRYAVTDDADEPEADAAEDAAQPPVGRGGEKPSVFDRGEAEKPREENASARSKAERAPNRPRPERPAPKPAGDEGEPTAASEAPESEAPFDTSLDDFVPVTPPEDDPFAEIDRGVKKKTPRSSAFADRKRELEKQQALEGKDPFDGYDKSIEEFATSKKPVVEEKKRRHGFNVDPDQDFNGDGKIDQFDAIEADRRSLGLPITILLSLAAVVGIASFFGVHALFETATGDLEHITIASGLLPSESTETSPDGTLPTGGQPVGGEGQEGTQNGGESPEGAGSGYSYVDRSDYDPEDAVRNLPMANDFYQAKASAVMRYVRTAIMNGDVNAFNNAIALNDIADVLAREYADYAAPRQNLNAADQQLLYESWRDQYIINEKQHVVDKDVYASSFGGRIREVRQSDIDPHTLYVVMESVAGDHQRLCLILHGDESDTDWTITGVNAPSGYIAMICQGRTVL